MRLIRYWVFLVVAYLLAIVLYIYYSVIHALGSSLSATIGFVGPRYIISGIGFFYLIVFITGIVFLAFDVRARDARERMLEVLDSRPYSNLDLVLGRFLGLFLSAWIPIVILVLIIQGVGWALPYLGSPVGGTIEPFSLFSFPVFIALPATAFSCALVMLITLLVRQQLIALVLSVAAIAGLYSLSVNMLPYTISSSLDLMGFYQVNLPSDWVPSIAASFSGWLQRVAVLLLALGLLFFAALIHPRLDGGNRRVQTISALAITTVGLLLIIKVYQLRFYEIDEIEKWRLAHEEMRDQVFPDIISMQGVATIEPGADLAVELELVFKAPPDIGLKQALFSLNPGLDITRVSDGQGNALSADFHHGLLDIALSVPLPAGEQTRIKLQFQGKPNTLFAYLDSAISHRNLAFGEAEVELLGLKNAIFSRHYVALMPGICWLPASGVNVGRDDTRERPRDFYTLQLKARMPAGWIAAGPGLRTENKRSDEYVEYDFSPQSSIAEAALLAAPFKRYVTEIDNIVFELLLHPDHNNNIEVLAGGKEEIKQWIADRISLAREMGLEYPFRAFTLVEVPNTLRGYAGGWRMGTALAPPSMVLMKETSLPTARFDFDVKDMFGKGRPLRDEEDGAAKVIRNRLIEFFTNDFTGGNVFTGVAASYFAHQTSATGRGAIALDYTLKQLATLVLSGQRSYFSVARIADLDQSIQAIIGSSQQPGTTISERVINTLSADPEVWESALSSPLNDIDPWKNPRLSVDLLTLKAGGVAQVIYDSLGPEKTGQIVAALLAHHRGESYTREDVAAAGNGVDSRLGTLIEDWFTGTGLAGFTSGQARLYQLPENDNGDIRYQLRVHIKNDEAVTGFTRVSWASEQGGVRTHSDPIRISGHTAVEFGVILFEVPAEAYIEPYLSLNRKDFLVRRFNASDLVTEDLPAFTGVRMLAWEPPDDTRIIVDDLDLGFSILAEGEADGFRLAGQSRGVFDRGLPLGTLEEFPSQWSRLTEKTAWGKYRHTLAFIRPGDGGSKASFKAKIPRLGRWKLEFHLPHLWFVANKELGQWELELVTENGRETVAYNAKAGLAGWNFVGEYDLAAGDVRVELSNKTSRLGVIADAVAWSLVN